MQKISMASTPSFKKKRNFFLCIFLIAYLELDSLDVLLLFYMRDLVD